MEEYFDIVYEGRKKRDEDRLSYPQSIYWYDDAKGHQVFLAPSSGLDFRSYSFEYYPTMKEWVCRVTRTAYNVSNPIKNEFLS